MTEGRRVTSKVSDSSVIVLLMTIVFGGLSVVLLGYFGYINLATVGQYIVWILLGVAGFAVFVAPITKSKYDDIIALYLLLLSIGGFIGTYLINNNMVSVGMFVLVGLGLISILLMVGFAKETYPKLRR